MNGLGDYDTHQGEAERHPALMADLDAGIESFFTTLEGAGAAERALVMTVSEFGRRPAENGSGTDHGTAAPHFLVGSRVKGGRYGAPPSLTQLDARGNLAQTADFRVALRHRARRSWLGVERRAGRSAAASRPCPSSPGRPAEPGTLGGVFERLADLETELEKLESQLSELYASGDQQAAAAAGRRHRRAASPIVEVYRDYRGIEQDLAEAREMLDGEHDAEMREYLAAEIDRQGSARWPSSRRELRELLVPRDPDDGKNVIVEIRGGEGGEEGNLWAGRPLPHVRALRRPAQVEARGADPPAVGHERPAARSRSW